MRAALAAALCGALGACGAPSGDEFSYWAEGKTAEGGSLRTEVETNARVIDQADGLSPGEEAMVDDRAAKLSQRTGKTILVLTVPDKTASLEQFGWAINGQNRTGDTVLLLVQPGERRVRVESGGALAPEEAARVASAMQPALMRKDLAGAMRVGLDRLGTELDAKG